MAGKVRITVWSDYVCPFCYLGYGQDFNQTEPFGGFSLLSMAETPILLLSLPSFTLKNAITKSFAR